MATQWLDLTSFKTRLGVTGSGSDALYTAVLEAVESGIERFVGGPILNASATEVYLGNWQRVLVLRRRPVVSVASVHESFATPPAFDATTLLTAGTHYRLRTDVGTTSRAGLLDRLNGVWGGAWERYPTRLSSHLAPARQGSVQVVYVAGWGATADDLPAEFLEAGYLEGMAVLAAVTSKKGQAFQSESLNGYSYSLGQIQTGTFGSRVPTLASPLAAQMLWAYRDMAGVGDGLA